MSRGRTVNSVFPFVAWHRSTNADFVLSRTARMLFGPLCNGLRGAPRVTSPDVLRRLLVSRNRYPRTERIYAFLGAVEPHTAVLCQCLFRRAEPMRSSCDIRRNGDRHSSTSLPFLSADTLPFAPEIKRAIKLGSAW